MLSTFKDTSAKQNACTYAQQCADVDIFLNASATRLYAFADAFTETFSSACLYFAACAYDRFVLLSPANGWREGESSWPSHWYLEHQVSQCGSWNLTCTYRQHQATATKAYNRARLLTDQPDLHVELWSHLSLLGNWQADEFTCIFTPQLWDRYLWWKLCVL